VLADWIRCWLAVPVPRWLRDVALSVAIAVPQLVGSYFASLHGPHGGMPLDAPGFLLLVVGPVVLLARRRFPAGVLVVTFGATLGYAVLGYSPGPIFLALIAAFVTAVRAGRRLISYAVLAAGYVSFLLATDYFAPAPALGAYLGLAAWLLVLAAVAELTRFRRDRAAAAAQTREEQARRRAGEERLRIARELHDAIGHHLSLISVQSGVALHLVDERPDQARGALEAVNQASKEALGELRSVLAVFRDVDGDAPRSPAPGLAQVDDLVARARDAGLRVRLERAGATRTVPAGVDAASYRIVQESLTNVTRHAGSGASATVRIGYGEHDLDVRVDDDGAGTTVAAHPNGGSGIAGMRERAGVLGGELHAGPREGGGFRVDARLPLRPAGDGNSGSGTACRGRADSARPSQ
jgi:signal transduction histidine kinase